MTRPPGSGPTPPRLRVYVVADEVLAVKRLARLLEATGRVEIVGTSSDPEAAVEALRRDPVDLLFLDVEMPGMNGFELVTRLADQPFIVFTTAFDQYALRAFEVNSIDYLLKPIEPQQLERALDKLERLGGGRQQGPDMRALLDQLSRALQPAPEPYPARIAGAVVPQPAAP